MSPRLSLPDWLTLAAPLVAFNAFALAADGGVEPEGDPEQEDRLKFWSVVTQVARLRIAVRSYSGRGGGGGGNKLGLQDGYMQKSHRPNKNSASQFSVLSTQTESIFATLNKLHFF